MTAVARAQEVPEPQDVDYLGKGVVISWPDGRRVELTDAHFLLTRKALDKALIDSAALEGVSERLKECEKRAARLKGSGTSWLRWSLTGAVVVAAFVVGYEVGR